MNAPIDIPYAEFAIQSNFSFLQGASKPEELAVAAKLLGLSAMGLADRNSVAGVVRAWQQTKVEKLPYHPGCRLVFSDGTPEVLAYPQNREGWGHLCRMLTAANMRGEKGAPDLVVGDLFEWGGLLSLAVLPDLDQAPKAHCGSCTSLKDSFAQSLWLAVSPAYDGNDRFRLEQAASIARMAGLPLMAVNDVFYHVADRRPLQDVLTAIRLNVPVAEAGYELRANAERYLKPPAEMARLFRRYPEAIAETMRFKETLKFSLDELKYNYPDEPTESGLEPQAELERLTWEGAGERYPNGVPEKVKTIIRHELDTVARPEICALFPDCPRHRQICPVPGYPLPGARLGCQFRHLLLSEDHRCRTGGHRHAFRTFHFRGSATSHPISMSISSTKSAISSSNTFTGNTAGNVPRWLRRWSLTGAAPPCAKSPRRWGCRMTCEARFQDRSGAGLHPNLAGRKIRAGGLSETEPLARHVIDRANDIMGFPRHLSQHVGGFVITRDRLDEIVPIVKTAMDERKMVEWDKDDLDAVGILKVDVLALGMLSCLYRAFALLEGHYDVRDGHGRLVDLATIPAEDASVYDMICRADTIGVFQIESRAQMSMLPRLQAAEIL